MSIQNDASVDALSVGDVKLPLEATPQTSGTTLLKETLELMDRHRLGIVCITSEDGKLEGIITDGDLRRMLSSVQKPIAAMMSDDIATHAIPAPHTITSATPLKDAIAMMGDKQIWDLPVVDDGKLAGLLHLHPAIQAVMGIEK